jgi:MoxR-like ATPase
MNDDASTFEIPEYIHSRLKPQIYLDFPSKEEEKRILEANLPFLEEDIIDYVVHFLQSAHAKGEAYTVRDGINIARYAAKRLATIDSKQESSNMLREAIKVTLGDEATFYLP